MAKLIANSMKKFLIFALLEAAICGAAVAEEEDFRMINLYDEELKRNDNYSHISWYVASERSSVECGGVFKRLQNELLSPGYPDNYGDVLHCEYTFKSPFVCSSQYHFQFLEFSLEPSRDCYKDRLVIGDEETLCGTVLGSKRYNSTNGILKVKFVTDGWGGDKGFRIVVTRQPCDDNELVESSTAYTVYTTLQVAEDPSESTDSVQLSEKPFKVNSRQDIPPEFNPGTNGYLPPANVIPPANTLPPGSILPPAIPGNTCPPPCPFYPACPNYPTLPGYPAIPPSYPNYPTIPPNTINPIPIYPNYPSSNVPPYPGTVPPNCNNNPSLCYPNPPTYPSYPNYPSYPASPSYPPNNGDGTTSIGGAPPGYQPTVKDPELELVENSTTADHPQRQDIPPPPVLPPVLPAVPLCCRNVFSQKRFYLVSPGFPSFQTTNMDCLYHINRYSPNTCRLVINFKYFLLGDDRQGCADGFLEIDGRPICGCRTGLVYTSQWGNFPKFLRVRSRFNRLSNVQGFVLDIYQESCPYRYVQNQVAQNRHDNFAPQSLPTPFNITTIQTNSSSLYTHYHYNPNAQPTPLQSQKLRSVAQRLPEGPASRFYYPANTPSYGACTFNSLDWLRLKLESLWVSKPRCY